MPATYGVAGALASDCAPFVCIVLSLNSRNRRQTSSSSSTLIMAALMSESIIERKKERDLMDWIEGLTAE